MRTIQIPDVFNDAEYLRLDLQRLAGFRTLLSTPMMLQNEVVGVLSMWRNNVKPFNTRECELLEEFAVQGAIVMRQDALRRALANKVGQLLALREVGDVVGSTLDLDEVLDQIVSNAVRLTGTDGASIMEYDDASDSFHVRAAYGSSPELLKELRAVTIDRKSTLVGRALQPTAGHLRSRTWGAGPISTLTSTACTATGGAQCSRYRFCAVSGSWACW